MQDVAARAEPLIGITQRLAWDERHLERRDALAKGWGAFFSALGVPWMPLPNAGAQTVALAKQCAVTGLVFSGGENIGVHPERDETERLLLEWAKQAAVPLAGVCRGFQFIQHWLGGSLVRVNETGHVGTSHPVRLQNGDTEEVNSYHEWGIASLAQPLEILAVDPRDGTVEAACAGNLLGVMWHPERYAVAKAADLSLFASHFSV